MNRLVGGNFDFFFFFSRKGGYTKMEVHGTLHLVIKSRPYIRGPDRHSIRLRNFYSKRRAIYRISGISFTCHGPVIAVLL